MPRFEARRDGRNFSDQKLNDEISARIQANESLMLITNGLLSTK